MNVIAERLDRKLMSLSPERAASVEKLVTDVLEVLDAVPTTSADRAAAIEAHREHWRKMDLALDRLDWSDFERPDQGVEEIRQDA